MTPETPNKSTQKKNTSWTRRIAVGSVAVLALVGVGASVANSQTYGNQNLVRDSGKAAQVQQVDWKGPQGRQNDDRPCDGEGPHGQMRGDGPRGGMQGDGPRNGMRGDGPRAGMQGDMRGGPRGNMRGEGPMGGFGERGLERMLASVDATDEQVDKIKAIFAGVRDEMGPRRGQMRDTREQAMTILGADTIDTAAVEKLRAERVAEFDQSSQKLTKALVDAAQVLTADQRAELLKHFQENGRGPRW